MPTDAKITPIDGIDGDGAPLKSARGKPVKPEGCIGFLKSQISRYDFADTLLDPYVKITAVPSLESKKTKDITDVVDRALWEETMEFAYSGKKQGQLFVEVWDEDVGTDDLIGTATVDLSKVFKDPAKFVEFKLDLSDSDLNDCGELNIRVKLAPDSASTSIAESDRAKGAEIAELRDQRAAAQQAGEKPKLAGLDRQIRELEETLGLYPGNLTVEVVDAYRLKNFEKEVGRVEDDKRLHFLACGMILVYLLISFVYTKLETTVPGGDEMWTYTDCVYFAVCTLTTVGYGDLFPQTKQGKIFTCFYVYFGIGMISAAVGYLINVLLETRSSGVAQMMAEQSDASELRDKKKKEMRKRFMTSGGLVLFFTLLGAVMYSQVFDIYGYCDIAEDPECLFGTHGGQAFLDAMYMSCITMTSVGYGDFSPQTQGGRIFGIFWIMSGGFVVVQAAGDLADSFLDAKQDEINRKIVARNLKTKDLLAIDDDDSGEIDELEYIGHMLVKLRKCEPEDIQELRDRFAELDKSGDGTLSPSDFAAAGI